MKIKSLLVVSAVAAAAIDSSAFEWEPSIVQPNQSVDVTSSAAVETLSFYSGNIPGVAMTDVMPKWIDEDGTEITAVSGKQNPWGWDPTEFQYSFKLADFKGNGEYTLLFPEGMLVDAEGGKSKSLEYYYSFDIPEFAPPMFEDFKVLSVSPDFSQPQALWNKQVVTINTNHNDAIGYTKLMVTDQTAGESVTISSNYTTGRVLGNPSEISWTVEGDFKFYEGHQYTAEFVFYNGTDEWTDTGMPTQVVDKVTYEFTGKVEGYKYSDITLLSITPEPYTVVINDPSLAVFTYEFSGPVNVYKAASPLGQNGMNVFPASSLSSNEDKTVWTLDLSNDSYVNSVDAMLTIYVYARDLDGNQLKGDFGEETESCFTAEWVCDLGGKAIVMVSPDPGETLDRLTEIVVKSESGEPMSWSWSGAAVVKNILGQTLGTLVYESEATEDAALEFRFTKWMDDNWNVTPIDLVKEGFYTVEFDPGCFVFGEQFESVYSRSLTSVFHITGTLDTPENPVDPAEQEVFYYDRVSPESGSTVTSIEKIQLWYPDIVDTMGKDAVIYNTSDNSVVSYAQVIYNWDDLYLIDVELFDPVTKAGEYEVVIPSRAICTSEFFESDGKRGICNPEIKLIYTVDPNGGSSVGAISTVGEHDVYDVHGRIVLRKASSGAIKALPAGIYVVGGRKIVVK